MTWYDDSNVIKEMLNYTLNREVLLREPKDSARGMTVRYFRMHDDDSARWILGDQIREGELFNFHYSLATFKDGLFLKSRDHKKYTNQRIHWHKYHDIKIIDFDFALDLDIKYDDEMDYAILSMQDLHKFFNKFNVPHEIRFSGNGFHFVIPSRFFPKSAFCYLSKTNNSIYSKHIELFNLLVDEVSEMLDGVIYDSKRVIKIPYSLAIYKDYERVVLPLISELEIKNFNLKYVNPLHWVGNIHGRGTKLFNPNGNLNKLVDNYNLKW